MICKDNFDEAVSTFNSIIVQLKSFDEIVVVDSSRSENIKDYIIGNAAKVLASPIIILHQMAFMMRKLLHLARKNDWICFINSGDILLEPGQIYFTMQCLYSVDFLFIFLANTSLIGARKTSLYP